MGKFILTLLLFFAVSDLNQQKTNIFVDPEIRPYWKEIIRDISGAGVQIDLDQPIKITLIDEERQGVIGIAHGMFDRERVEITIDRTFWTNFTDVERKWVLIHEMGHDFWGIFHHGEGIMRPYHVEGESEATYNKAIKEMLTAIYNWQNKIPLSQIV